MYSGRPTCSSSSLCVPVKKKAYSKLAWSASLKWKVTQIQQTHLLLVVGKPLDAVTGELEVILDENVVVLLGVLHLVFFARLRLLVWSLQGGECAQGSRNLAETLLHYSLYN